MTRRTVIALTLVVAAACSDSAIPATTGAALVPTTLAATTTIASPSPTVSDEGLDEVLGELSVLALAATPGDLHEGEYVVLPGDSRLVMVEGHWWTTPGGNVYTDTDLDRALVAAEMERLVTEVLTSADAERIDAFGYRDHYRGREFQLGLGDWIPVGPPPADDIALLQVIYRDVTGPERVVVEDCVAAVEAFRASSNRFVMALAPDFSLLASGKEEWLFPVGEYLDAVAAERSAAAEACNQLLEMVVDFSGHSLRVVRSVAGQAERLDLLVDPGIYSEPTEELAVSVLLSPSSRSVAPPASPDPAPMVTSLHQFLLAIDECGQLPWIYSNFAAANSYTSPDDGGYEGPTPFDSSYPCADRVPGA